MMSTDALALRVEQIARAMRIEFQRRVGRGPRGHVHHLDDGSTLERLAAWQRELGLIARELKSRAHALRRDAASLRAEPRELRFRAQQSIRDRNSLLARVSAEVNRLLFEVVPVMQTDLGRPLTAEEVFIAIDEMRDVYDGLAGMSHARDTMIHISKNVRSQDRLDTHLSRYQARDLTGADLTVAVPLLYTLIRLWFLEKTRQRGRPRN